MSARKRGSVLQCCDIDGGGRLCNQHGTRVVVLPFTSNVDSLYPGEAMVTLKGRAGRALGDQIRSIDKRRLKATVGRVTADEMVRIDEALAITLGLQ